ncbi:MAG TPA: pyrimidine 5'-nucleotidase [Anaerolineae bacterium]|nr:pyrimidine 5'-nucleotidase [Anaerolineae bacterium]
MDLDETMYPKETGLMDLIGNRINEYMSLRLGVDSREVVALRKRYYEKYGTTGRGLYLDYGLDVQDYFEFVHDLPVEEVLQPDPRLDEMLSSLEEEKVIFTNATAGHAQRVLRALGVENHFGPIIGIRELDYIPKPDARAYHKVLELVDARPEECVLVDDRARNLAPGQGLGMTTVLVGSEDAADGADYAIDEVVELGAVMEKIRARR